MPLMRSTLLAILIALPGTGLTMAFDQTIHDIQQALSDLGYDPGSKDGELGTSTLEALSAAETAFGLEPSENLEKVRDYLREALQWKAATDLAPRDTASLALEINVASAGGQVGALSADFKLYAEAAGNTPTVYFTETGRKLRTFYGHSDSIDSLAFSPNGKLLASSGGDRTVRLWNIETGHSRSLKAQGRNDFNMAKLAFTPDGNTLLVVSIDGVLMMFDVDTATEIARWDSPNSMNFLSQLAVSTDGELVAWSSGGTVAVASLSKGKRISTFEIPGQYMNSLQILPDNSGLAAIVGTTKYGEPQWHPGVFVFDIDGQQIAAVPSSEDADAMAISPDSDEIAFNQDNDTIMLYRRDSGDTRAIETTDRAVPLSYTNDGRLYVGSLQPYAIDLDGPATLPDLSATAGASNLLTFGADGLLRVLSGQGGLRWNLADGTASNVIPDLPAISRGWPFTDADASLQTVLHQLQATATVYPTGSGDAIQTMVHPDTSWVQEAISDDGSHVATVGEGGDLRVWDVGSGEQLARLATAGLGAIEFSPDGSRIAVGSNYAPQIWDWENGTLVHQLAIAEDPGVSYPEGIAMTTVFSRDGQYLAIGSVYVGISVWNAETGKLLWQDRVSTPHISEAKFSEDGTRLVLMTPDLITTRDVMTGAIIGSDLDTGEDDNTFALSHDNSRLAVDTPNGLKIYDTATNELLVTTAFIRNGEWVAITPEGFFSASENGAQYVTVSRGMTVYAIDQFYNALYRPDLVQAKLMGDPSGLVADAAKKLDLTKAVESGGAPNVMIASPAPGADLDADTVDVIVHLVDQGGGIGKIEWRVNGITLGIETRGFDRLAVDADVAAAAPVTVTRALSLDPGENAIEVVAYNAEGVVASEPAQVNVNWTGTSSSTPPRLYVLAAGINDYHDSRLQLTYATSDARAIAAAFQAAGDGLYESVEVTTVLDAAVTADNLDEVFADLAGKVRPRDVFVLFMAGHGKTQDGRYYFLPQDFRYTDETSVASGGIDQDQFQQWLAMIPARKSLLLYDTCDSGSLTGAVATRGLEEVAALARMTRAMGRTVLSASTDDAPALEGYNGHGVFTYALLQALGDGDANSDGTIDVTELAGSIDRSVPEISFAAFNLRQIPQMSIIGSDFPVANRIAVLDPANVASPTVPSAPTHVVIVAAEVFDAAAENAARTASLAVGSLIRVIDTGGDWSQVAKDGKIVGYIETASLAAIQ